MLLALALLGTAGACRDAPSSLDLIRQRGFLRAGYAEEPPYAFVDSSGRVTGESPEMLRAVVDRAGLPEIRWVRLDFPELMAALEEGRVDVVASGLYRTSQRAQSVRFTRPTSCSRPALVARVGEALPAGLPEVVATERVLAVLDGSVEETAARRLGIPASRIVAVPDLRTALVAVRQGQADLLAISEPTAAWALRGDRSNGLVVHAYAPPMAVKDLIEGCSALAVRVADEELATLVDSMVAGALLSPRHRRLLDSLGFTSPPDARGAP